MHSTADKAITPLIQFESKDIENVGHGPYHAVILLKKREG